jgi:hypothetical protein
LPSNAYQVASRIDHRVEHGVAQGFFAAVVGVDRLLVALRGGGNAIHPRAGDAMCRELGRRGPQQALASVIGISDHDSSLQPTSWLTMGLVQGHSLLPLDATEVRSIEA